LKQLFGCTESSKVMKAARFFDYGGPDVLHVDDDVELPRPSVGQAVVRVAATSFNPVDAAIRGGYLREVVPVTLPHTPGIDFAGTVAAVGEGVVGWSIGEAVIGLLPSIADDGAAAEFVLAPADVLSRAPSSIPLADAAALPCTALTAWQALFEHANLRGGQRVLINGGGGGVGGYAIQMAKQAGATVVATASARSRDTVHAFGAD
jgi:NADPH:quinone reductase-like Zn-dependent oxidoreductase